MFKKKPRRNFRQRKGESTDEDEQNGESDGSRTQASADRTKPSTLPHNRGVKFSSKGERNKSDSSSEDVGEVHETFSNTIISHHSKECKDERQKKENVLSFSDDKDGRHWLFFYAVSEAQALFMSLLTPARRDVTVVASPRERSDSDVSGEELSPESDGDDKSTMSSSASSVSSMVIPDARSIQAARRRRQQARAQTDYISLGRNGESSPRTPDHQDLEERSDDNCDDDEPDDHERRIEFAPRSKTIRERIAEKMGASNSDDSGSDDQEREDNTLWEEQQIGKGVKRHSRSRRKQRVDIPECLPPVSLSMVKKRIAGKLSDLREVHRAHEAELRRMEWDMESSRTSLENLESGSADSQLRFYRTTNAYVQNLVECLREKVVEINSVEVDMHTLLSEQADALLSRRREAVHQESSRLQQLNNECLLPDSKSSPEEEAEVQKERAAIMVRCQGVFSDVQEDFWDVKRVLSRFDEWRRAFSETYHSAYISLCLPKLLNPLIRHQLIGWNPLQAAAEDFEALPWFSAVETFCHGQGYQEAEHTDRKTQPAIIEKTLLPKIQGFVELVWDPLSSRQSLCLSALCCRLQEDYSLFEGEQSKPVKAFLEAVSERLRSFVDDDIFIPLYPKKFLDDKSSPQRRFRDQQFWTAVKLLGNMAQWNSLLPEHVLKELMLDKLLNRYLMMTLLNETHCLDSVRKCKKVAMYFPQSWFKDLSSCPSELKSFSEHLLQTVHSVCKQQPNHPNTRAMVSDVLTVLGSIMAWDKVATISDKYHYKDLVDTLNLSY
uniref:GCF C-terminal domain-containing protein n=1 Tax=Esox lucius TaxID=8010 RepID=A0A6Q2Y1A9_ESOLU